MGQLYLPLHRETLWKKGRMNGRVIWCGNVQQKCVFWDTMTGTLMYSLQMWLFAQALHKVVPVNVSTWTEKTYKVPFVHEVLLVITVVGRGGFIFLNGSHCYVALILVSNTPCHVSEKNLIKLCGPYTKRRQESKRRKVAANEKGEWGMKMTKVIMHRFFFQTKLI